jgi:hypothetical protein
MVFTPLLASTAVGTLEFRSVALPVRDIQPALAWPQNHFLTAYAKSIDVKAKHVLCVTTDGATFVQPYDELVIATGAAGSTFGIPGVYEHAHLLRDVSHAAAIRSQLIRILGLASTPGALESMCQQNISVFCPDVRERMHSPCTWTSSESSAAAPCMCRRPGQVRSVCQRGGLNAMSHYAWLQCHVPQCRA